MRTPLGTGHEGPASLCPALPGQPGEGDAGWLCTAAPTWEDTHPSPPATTPGSTPDGLPSLLGAPPAWGPGGRGKRSQQREGQGGLGNGWSLATPQHPDPGWGGSHLAKTFLAMRVRAVSVCRFRSVRPGCCLRLPRPLLPALDEPRSTPVAASTSLMNSGSCQSANRPETHLAPTLAPTRASRPDLTRP